MKRPAALAFKAALEEFQRYRTTLDDQLKTGKITKGEHDKLLSQKGKELDL